MVAGRRVDATPAGREGDGRVTGLMVAFVTGLLHGAHCLGMCGGFVVASAAGGGRPWLFHVGRLASYTRCPEAGRWPASGRPGSCATGYRPVISSARAPASYTWRRASMMPRESTHTDRPTASENRKRSGWASMLPSKIRPTI